MLKVSNEIMLAVLIVLVLRRSLLKSASAKVFLILWVPIMLQFIFPFQYSVSIQQEIFLVHTAEYEQVAVNQEYFSELMNSKQMISIDLLDLVKTIWMIGVLIFLVKWIFDYVKLLRMIHSCSPVNDEVFIEFITAMKLPCRAVVCDDFYGAAITLSVPSVLIISKDCLTMSKTKKELLLSHENIHFKKHHHRIRLIMQFLKIIWWFHPGIYLAEKQISKELEYWCDEEVVNLNIASFTEYAELMVLTQSSTKLSNQIALSSSGRKLKERIERYLRMKKGMRYTISAILIALIMCAGLMLEFKRELKVLSAEETISQTINTINENSEGAALEIKEAEELQESKEKSEVTLQDWIDSMIKPINNAKITCGWGCYAGHTETDVINTVDRNGEVYAVLGGVILDAGYNSEDGNYVIIEHELGVVTSYNHLAELYVKKMDSVNQGTIIGRIGSTGMSTGEHLGFKLMIDNVSQNIDWLFK